MASKQQQAKSGILVFSLVFVLVVGALVLIFSPFIRPKADTAGASPTPTNCGLDIAYLINDSSDTTVSPFDTTLPSQYENQLNRLTQATDINLKVNKTDRFARILFSHPARTTANFDKSNGAKNDNIKAQGSSDLSTAIQYTSTYVKQNKRPTVPAIVVIISGFAVKPADSTAMATVTNDHAKNNIHYFYVNLGTSDANAIVNKQLATAGGGAYVSTSMKGVFDETMALRTLLYAKVDAYRAPGCPTAGWSMTAPADAPIGFFHRFWNKASSTAPIDYTTLTDLSSATSQVRDVYRYYYALTSPLKVSDTYLKTNNINIRSAPSYAQPHTVEDTNYYITGATEPNKVNDQTLANSYAISSLYSLPNQASGTWSFVDIFGYNFTTSTKNVTNTDKDTLYKLYYRVSDNPVAVSDPNDSSWIDVTGTGQLFDRSVNRAIQPHNYIFHAAIDAKGKYFQYKVHVRSTKVTIQDIIFAGKAD